MTAPPIVEPIVTPPAEIPDPAVIAAQAEVDAAEATRVAEAAAAAEATRLRDEAGRFAKYDLKLPPDSKLDPAIVERTAATARELGLSNEAGQKLLDRNAVEVEAAITAATKAVTESLKPDTGPEWIRINDAYKAAALADPDLGAGDPAKLAAVSANAQSALNKFFPEVTTEQLKATLLASNPLFLKGLARIGAAMSEPHSIVPGGTRVEAQKSLEERMYPAQAATK